MIWMRESFLAQWMPQKWRTARKRKTQGNPPHRTVYELQGVHRSFQCRAILEQKVVHRRPLPPEQSVPWFVGFSPPILLLTQKHFYDARPLPQSFCLTAVQLSKQLASFVGSFFRTTHGVSR